MTATLPASHPLPQLRDAADTASRDAQTYPAGAWARVTLETMAGHCRTAATVFDRDPTLVDEPENTGRFRVLWLIAELARMCRAQIKQAEDPQRKDGGDRVDEAEAILQRAGELTTKAVVKLPRATGTADGVRFAAQVRLAANHDLVAQAAQLLQEAVEPALRLDVGDPQADELADMARRLTVVSELLKVDRDADAMALSDALGLRS